MNHFEQLTAEWLQFNGYFVRVGVHVGPRAKGGYEGELDVVGFHPAKAHLVHIECSLDADNWSARERRFAGKFERGRRYARDLFSGMDLPEHIDQVALLQFVSGKRTELAGARIVTGNGFINEIMRRLARTSPAKSAVPSILPLIRTLQLAASAAKATDDGAAGLLGLG
ncbi:MAG: hypothetical protein NW206_16020 [Hyphomonadaceae bacterium]|nr:hypothetical protein [Hyphomonadaceae bacterium]